MSLYNKVVTEMGKKKDLNASKFKVLRGPRLNISTNSSVRPIIQFSRVAESEGIRSDSDS